MNQIIKKKERKNKTMIEQVVDLHFFFFFWYIKDSDFQCFLSWYAFITQ